VTTLAIFVQERLQLKHGLHCGRAFLSFFLASEKFEVFGPKFND
jgi:hypothetical protein